MDIVFILLPASLLLALVGLCAYIWNIKRDQYEDLDTPPLRMLIDDEESDS